MSESNESYDQEDIWEFVKANPRLVGIAVSEEKNLDLLTALMDVHLALTSNRVQEATYMLTMIASVLVATATGTADEIVNEIIIQESMETFDQSVKEMFNEGRK